ncbi:hypothetical protein [Rurimicrobium arvi]|uniref:DUF4138 domain-containing protein n=1 Tax=Rurimicrobium arvi TaxID=2049916 RepID=A0ABP8MFY8_9BACT
MKKIFLFAALLGGANHLYAQDKNALAKDVFEPLRQNTTRVVMDDDPKSYVLQHPVMQQDAELITIQSGEKTINVSLRDVSRMTLENYGVVFSNRDQEVTFYMDLKHNPALRERIRDAFGAYTEERDRKRYTVRE